MNNRYKTREIDYGKEPKRGINPFIKDLLHWFVMGCGAGFTALAVQWICK